MSEDPFEGTPFVAADIGGEKPKNPNGVFDFPNNTVDLIGLFLDPDIRAARNRVNARIDAGVIQNGGVKNVGGRQNNQTVTSAAATIQKAVVSIHALNKQAERNRAKRR